MKTFFLVLFCYCLTCAGADSPSLRSWQVYFSPNGGCTEAVSNALAKARSSVLVQAYSFTSPPIARALLDARKRGVSVQVILDKSQKTEKYSEADFLANSGVATFIDASHAIAHNKVMVIDGRWVITGSFNFTRAAESRNAENLLILEDTVLAQRYTQNWHDHLRHAQGYQVRSTPPTPAPKAKNQVLTPAVPAGK